MTANVPERWIKPATLDEATRAQREMAAAGETADRVGPVATVGGADVSMAWRDSYGPIHAAFAPLALDGLRPLAPAAVTALPRFPYVPGYLGFREVPALIEAWAALTERPELLFVDGHGRAHPRRCGIATHLGVVLDVPTIGIGKTLLCGRVTGEVGMQPGDRAPIVDRGETIGMAVRTTKRGGPVFVGVGHRVSLDSAVDWVLRLSAGRRLPLPIRLAHDAANAARVAAARA